MWKREEPVRSVVSSSDGDIATETSTTLDIGQKTTNETSSLGRDIVNIGKSVIIKGELSGSVNLTIEGQVEGKIELRQHVLTIGPNSKIKAQIFAKSVVVMGEIHGNITATDRVNIRETGSVDGDVTAPRVAIAEGAHFRGSIDMQRSQAPTSAEVKAHTKPVVASASSQVARVVQR